MALRFSKNDVPENTVVLNKNDAIQYQWNIIKKWKPQKEVWPFSYGVAFLGGVAALSGLYINTRIRKSLKLGSFGNWASAISVAACPATFVIITQLQMVTENTLLPIKTCPLCIEMKSIVLQNCGAVIYPVVLSPIANLLIAKRDGRFRLPYHKTWKEVIYYFSRLFKPIVPSLAFISSINTLAASIIVYKQFDCISYIQEVLTVEDENDEFQQDD